MKSYSIQPNQWAFTASYLCILFIYLLIASNNILSCDHCNCMMLCCPQTQHAFLYNMQLLGILTFFLNFNLFPLKTRVFIGSMKLIRYTEQAYTSSLRVYGKPSSSVDWRFINTPQRQVIYVISNASMLT